MFEVGRLIARLEVVGRALASSEVDQFGRSLKASGKEAEGAAKSQKSLGSEVNTTASRASRARSEIDGAASSTKRAAAEAAAAGTATSALGNSFGDASSRAAVLDDSLDETAGRAQDAAAGMDTVGTATAGAGDKATEAAPRVRTVREEISGLSDESKRAATEVGGSFAIMGAGILAMTGLAVAKFAEFDQGMSQVQSATHESAGVMAELRQAAVDAGGATKYSATEAAQGIVELSKAGVSAKDVLGGGLAGALTLAAAGEVEVADAAETAATAMTQFGLTGDKIPHIADLLAAGAGKAQGGVADLSMALKQGGLVASQFGLSVDDTVGVLAQFASAGLIGSDAGTSLKTMLLQLANPSKESAALMEELGIQAYDASGKFAGMESITGQMVTAFEGKTQAERDSAMATIFGSDAIRAASVLYQGGTEKVRYWADAVNDAGYAAKTASDLQNNLAGDVEKLGGSFDTALIQSGSGANEVLRQMVQILTGVIDAYSNLPAPVQQGVLWLGLILGAVALAGGAFLMAVPKVLEFRAALQTLQTAAPAAMGKLKGLSAFLGGPWGVALVAAALGIEVLSKWMDSLQASSAEMQNSLLKAKSAADIFATAGKGKDAKWWKDVAGDLGNLQGVIDAAGDQWNNFLTRFDSSHFGAFDALRDIGTELSSLASTDLPLAQERFRMLAAETDGTDQSLWRLVSTMGPYRDSLYEIANAQGIDVTSGSDAENQRRLLALATGEATVANEENAEATLTVGDAYLETKAKGDDLLSTLTTLLDALNELNGVGQDATSTNIAYQEQLAAVAEQIEKVRAGTDGLTGGLDINTESGRANTSVLLEQAKASQDAAQKQFELDQRTQGTSAATDGLRGRLEEGRQKLIDNAMQLGATADEAQALADKIYGIPSEKDFQMVTNAAATSAAIQDVINKINSIPGYREVVINQQIRQTGADPGAVKSAYQANGGTVEFFASGGESHHAQIVSAGTWRVFGEEETGGEGYIPLGFNKRQQALPVLGDIANRFGYELVERGSGRGSAAAGGTTAAESDTPRPVYLDSGVFLGWLREQIEGGMLTVQTNNDRQLGDTLARAGIR